MGVLPPNLTDMLQSKLQYDGERQKVLAQNIASKDVPGFKARDLMPLDFKNALGAGSGKMQMAVTSPQHMTGIKAGGTNFASVKQKDSFDITMDGNTVSIEQQMMKVTQNAMDFQMSTNLYKKINNLFKEALGLQPST